MPVWHLEATSGMAIYHRNRLRKRFLSDLLTFFGIYWTVTGMKPTVPMRVLILAIVLTGGCLAQVSAGHSPILQFEDIWEACGLDRATHFLARKELHHRVHERWVGIY